MEVTYLVFESHIPFSEQPAMLRQIISDHRLRRTFLWRQCVTRSWEFPPFQPNSSDFSTYSMFGNVRLASGLEHHALADFSPLKTQQCGLCRFLTHTQLPKWRLKYLRSSKPLSPSCTYITATYLFPLYSIDDQLSSMHWYVFEDDFILSSHHYCPFLCELLRCVPAIPGEGSLFFFCQTIPHC